MVSLFVRYTGQNAEQPDFWTQRGISFAFAGDVTPPAGPWVPTEAQIESALSSLDSVKVGSPFVLFTAVYEQSKLTPPQDRKELVKLWQELSKEHKGLFVAEFQQLRRRTAKAPRPAGDLSAPVLTGAAEPSEYAKIRSR